MTMKRLFQLFAAGALLFCITSCADNSFEEIELEIDQQIKGNADIDETHPDGAIPPWED